MDSRPGTAELDARYSSDGASALDWADAVALMERAPIFWVVTVRSNGRPHVTPLLAVWLGGALYFSTGPTEQKARNLAENAQCTLMTGCNTEEGTDLVVEGDAVRIVDEATLRRVAEAIEAKYGPTWHYEVRDGAFHHTPGVAWVYELRPVTAYGFGKGDAFTHMRWRFEPSEQ
jgi:nitroimidazol reductase NimA-like FMN-containing flavoprotein (pyridoxamine 5'-phosphate oxidase superfamily)